ncbi:MAG: Fur family transcriptional regulator, ferric uptake regulator [Pseudonocardiales bacterium]|jgi:Fur family ferric uptake transcriptional regulator|nr:Fur family transcriptional regulator, ferric uptake regulator [Pseudonocardiales bacterium]
MEAMTGHSHNHTDDGPTGAGDLASALRTRGLRLTPQREQVLAAVRRLGHATPEQITEAVAGVDVTTVYRNLELLEELDLVRHTHLGHGAPAYRPAEDDHIHVVCHSCGSIVDTPAGLVDPLARRLRDEQGFELDTAHFAVFGRCRSCLEQPGEQSPRPTR